MEPSREDLNMTVTFLTEIPQSPADQDSDLFHPSKDVCVYTSDASSMEMAAMECNTQQGKMLTIDRDVFDRWCSIGIAEGLPSDTDIAKFFIAQYEQSKGGPLSFKSCIQCHRPLSMVCLCCKLPAQVDMCHRDFINTISPSVVTGSKVLVKTETLSQDPPQTVGIERITENSVRDGGQCHREGNHGNEATAKCSDVLFRNSGDAVISNDILMKNLAARKHHVAPVSQLGNDSAQGLFSSGIETDDKSAMLRTVFPGLSNGEVLRSGHAGAQIKAFADEVGTKQDISIPVSEFRDVSKVLNTIFVRQNTGETCSFSSQGRVSTDCDVNLTDQVLVQGKKIGKVETRKRKRVTRIQTDKTAATKGIPRHRTTKREEGGRGVRGTASETNKGRRKFIKLSDRNDSLSQQSDTTATDGSNEPAIDGSSETSNYNVTVTGRSNATAMDGSSETATDGSSETATGRSNTTATDGSGETATSNSSETAPGNCDETAVDAGNKSVDEERHCLNTENLKSTVCRFCGVDCRCHSQLLTHLRSHTREKPFVCKVCGASYSQIGHLKYHEWSHKSERPYTCDICGAGFIYAGRLKEHESIHTGEKPYECSDCGAAFRTKTILHQHLRIHSGVKPFVCDICGAAFHQSGNLKEHAVVHTTQRSFFCSLCDASFKTDRQRQRHEKTHEKSGGGKVYLCDRCPASFTSVGNLKRHWRKHTGEKPFKCTVSGCSKTFTDATALKRHMQRHRGEKHFTCEICAYSCLEKATMKKHVLVHTGEKPFACSVCQSRFTTKGNLKDHIKIHTGEKPYACSVCKRAFSQRSHYREHLKTHAADTPHKCSICDAGFKHPRTLKNHMKSHSAEAVVSSASSNKRDVSVHSENFAVGEDMHADKNSVSNCEGVSNGRKNMSDVKVVLISIG